MGVGTMLGVAVTLPVTGPVAWEQLLRSNRSAGSRVLPIVAKCQACALGGSLDLSDLAVAEALWLLLRRYRKDILSYSFPQSYVLAPIEQLF